MDNQRQFTFRISLDVLNHLGRKLYRNFVTILGEAISNSWDADAKNVCITIDKENRTIVIQDDGIGMTENDFSDKFLKVGYSKRIDPSVKRMPHRPFIGQKGIGKLSLLSCAESVTIITKALNEEHVGATINNRDLDEKLKTM